MYYGSIHTNRGYVSSLSTPVSSTSLKGLQRVDRVSAQSRIWVETNRSSETEGK